MRREGRLLHENWDRYDTRHVVYRPARLTPEALEAGYWHAYESFYRWGSILRGAAIKSSWKGRLRHVAYAGGWKKLEPLWDLVIRAKRVSSLLPVLETVLDEGKGTARASRGGLHASPDSPAESLPEGVESSILS